MPGNEMCKLKESVKTINGEKILNNISFKVKKMIK